MVVLKVAKIVNYAMLIVVFLIAIRMHRENPHHYLLLNGLQLVPYLLALMAYHVNPGTGLKYSALILNSLFALLYLGVLGILCIALIFFSAWAPVSLGTVAGVTLLILVVFMGPIAFNVYVLIKQLGLSQPQSTINT